MRKAFLVLFLLLLVPSCWPADVTIAGYKVYWGTAAGVYGTPTTIGNQLTYTVTNLGPGTWFFTVIAFDVDGNESDFATAADDPTKHYVSTTIGINRCDLNTDQKVDALDVQALINSILTAGNKGDINEDNKVNALDLQLLMRVITQQSTCPE